MLLALEADDAAALDAALEAALAEAEPDDELEHAANPRTLTSETANTITKALLRIIFLPFLL
jgi:hypothetical protein